MGRTALLLRSPLVPGLARRSPRRRIPRRLLQRVLAALALAGGSASAGYVYNASDFATQVVSSSSLSASPPFNDPRAVIGEQALKSNTSFDPATPSVNRVSIINSAYLPTTSNQTSLLASVDTGEQVTVKFDHPITHDAGHPYGQDLIVFGNSLFYDDNFDFTDDTTNLNTFRIAGGYGHGVSLSVSPDDVRWYTYNLDFVMPTNSYQWDATNARWTDTLSNPTVPLNPSLYSAFDQNNPSFPTDPTDPKKEITAAQVLALYGQSAGGTGIDISQSGFSSIQYVRFEAPSGDHTVIDAVSAVSDVPEPASVGGIAVVTTLVLARRRRREVTIAG